MEEILTQISHDHFVANFEELVIENQIQTAADVLISAEPEEQMRVIREAQPALLERFVQALDREDRIEVIDQLTSEARASLLLALEEVANLGHVSDRDLPVEDVETAADLIEEAIEESIERAPEPALSEEEPVMLPGQIHFAIVDEHLRRSTPEAAVISIYSNPTSAAQRELLEFIGIDDHMLESALDPDELSRLEYDFDERQTFIVLKRPNQDANGRPEQLGIASFGILMQPDRLTVVIPDDTPLVDEGDRAECLRMLLLRIMAAMVDEFLMELKRIKRTSREIQTRLSKSIENRELLRMFSLSEGLVYHINAIEGNARVLRRLRHLSKRLEFDEQELEFLDDIIIDNDQCSRQAQIFSTVLGGMLDARASIINNNMNLLLKNLTIINVVFLPLGVVSGMGGMSEFSMILGEYGIDWRTGYLIFTAGMIVLGLGSWWIVRMLIDRWGASNGSHQTAALDRPRR
jgi:magnesium transporter